MTDFAALEGRDMTDRELMQMALDALQETHAESVIPMTEKLFCSTQALRTRLAQPDSEPFGYFRAEPLGWTDCSPEDEGAIALYERPAKDPAPSVTIQQAWEWAGGNPEIQATADDLKFALEQLNKVCDEADAQPDSEPTYNNPFLSDVMTAAGLVAYGKQSKALAERLGAEVMRIRTHPARDPAPKPVNQALLAALKGLIVIVNDSRGVAGYHLNGATAEWDEFEEVGIAEAAIAQAEAK